MKAIWMFMLMLLVAHPVYATGGGNDDNDDVAQNQDQQQDQSQGQAQGQQQGQTVDVSTGPVNVETAAAGGAANNEGNSLSVESNYEASAPDIILVPNNNTVDCHKVYGISFSNTGGGGGIGWPYRDKACDYEQAAAAASAVGDHELAWFWRCHKPNLYTPYYEGRRFLFLKGKAAVADAVEACHQAMVGQVQKSNRIAILEDHIEELNVLRQTEADRYESMSKAATEACNEQKNRIADACKK